MNNRTSGYWATLGKLMSVILVVIANSLLARYLPPEDLGEYFILYSIVAVLAIVFQGGISQTMVKVVSESVGLSRYSKARKDVITILRVSILLVLVMSILLIIANNLFFSEVYLERRFGLASIYLVLVWVFLMSIQQVVVEAFRGFHDIRSAVLFNGIIASFLSVFFISLMMAFNVTPSLYLIIVVLTFSWFVGLAVSFLCLWMKLTKISSEKNVSLGSLSLSSMYSNSWPIWLVNIFTCILQNVDLWMIGYFSSKVEVAEYGAALRLVAFVGMPLLIFNSILPPKIVELNIQGKKQILESLLRKNACIAGKIAFVIFSGYCFIGEYVLGAIFGDFYKSAFALLIILSIGRVVSALSGSCAQVLMVAGFQRILMRLSLGVGILVIFFSLAVVKVYGAVGVAIVSTLGIIIQNVMMVFFVKRKLGIWTHIKFI